MDTHWMKYLISITQLQNLLKNSDLDLPKIELMPHKHYTYSTLTDFVLKGGNDTMQVLGRRIADGGQ